MERQKAIEANQRRLAALGLGSIAAELGKLARPQPSVRSAIRKAKEIQDATRRSLRVRGKAPIFYGEIDAVDRTELINTSQRAKRKRPVSVSVSSVVTNSSSVLPARIDFMNHAYLGRSIPMRYGGGSGRLAKAAAMNVLCGQPKTQPRFSRMSGIQQWSNAVALFVNVGGTDYENLFWTADSANAFKSEASMSSDTSRSARNSLFMTWFAQRTQHEESPVITRLLSSSPTTAHHSSHAAVQTANALATTPATSKAGVSNPATAPKAAQQLPSDSSGDNAGQSCKSKGCAVLLFCRLPDMPYVYCGQLEYVSHDPAARPMKFVWRLVHYADLMRADAPDNDGDSISDFRGTDAAGADNGVDETDGAGRTAAECNEVVATEGHGGGGGDVDGAGRTADGEESSDVDGEGGLWNQAFLDIVAASVYAE